jgi:hypothetical protein
MILFTIKMYLKNAVIFLLGTDRFVFATDPFVLKFIFALALHWECYAWAFV